MLPIYKMQSLLIRYSNRIFILSTILGFSLLIPQDLYSLSSPLSTFRCSIIIPFPETIYSPASIHPSIRQICKATTFHRTRIRSSKNMFAASLWLVGRQPIRNVSFNKVKKKLIKQPKTSNERQLVIYPIKTKRKNVKNSANSAKKKSSSTEKNKNILFLRFLRPPSPFVVRPMS